MSLRQLDQETLRRWAAPDELLLLLQQVLLDGDSICALPATVLADKSLRLLNDYQLCR